MGNLNLGNMTFSHYSGFRMAQTCTYNPQVAFLFWAGVHRTSFPRTKLWQDTVTLAQLRLPDLPRFRSPLSTQPPRPSQSDQADTVSLARAAEASRPSDSTVQKSSVKDPATQALPSLVPSISASKARGVELLCREGRARTLHPAAGAAGANGTRFTGSVGAVSDSGVAQKRRNNDV